MTGWEIRISRKLVQHNRGLSRTYGKYSVYIDNVAIETLAGFVCESPGPGDNGAVGVALHRRIEAGNYELGTHFGRYVSVGFPDVPIHEDGRMPGFQLLGTGQRTDILIHPGHPPSLYLSSIGCLNLTSAISSDEIMNFDDSWARVAAVIGSLRQFATTVFASRTDEKIPHASALIVGEPE